MTVRKQGIGEMRADKSAAAGYKIGCHIYLPACRHAVAAQPAAIKFAANILRIFFIFCPSTDIVCGTQLSNNL